MRASYVNPPELLTPVGNWIASRLPHIEFKRAPWGKDGNMVFRIYGFRPRNQFAIVDFTKARFYSDTPAWTRLRLFGLTVFERNREWSGLPGARG